MLRKKSISSRRSSVCLLFWQFQWISFLTLENYFSTCLLTTENHKPAVKCTLKQCYVLGRKKWFGVLIIILFTLHWMGHMQWNVTYFQSTHSPDQRLFSLYNNNCCSIVYQASIWVWDFLLAEGVHVNDEQSLTELNRCVWANALGKKIRPLEVCHIVAFNTPT